VEGWDEGTRIYTVTRRKRFERVSMKMPFHLDNMDLVLELEVALLGSNAWFLSDERRHRITDQQITKALWTKMRLLSYSLSCHFVKS
jgi:hypothetical protein